MAGHSSLGYLLGFLVILQKADLTPLSLSLRVALTRFSKDRVPQRRATISSLLTQNALMSRSRPACWFLHTRKSYLSCLNARNPSLCPGMSRDAPPNSLPGSSKLIPKKGCYRVLCPSWIPTSFSIHHLHHLPTPLSSNCSQPHLLTHPFLKGPPLSTHCAFFGLTGC